MTLEQTCKANLVTPRCNLPESHICMFLAHLGCQISISSKFVTHLLMLKENDRNGIAQKDVLLWPLAMMTTGSHSPAKSIASTYSIPLRSFITSIFGVGFPMSS